MKAFTLVILMALNITFISASSNHSFGFNTKVRAIAASRSVVLKAPITAPDSPEYGNKCQKYKGMQVAGIVLVSVGVPAIAGGGTLVNLGIRNGINDGDGFTTFNMIFGGSVLTIFGVAITAAGIPLTVVGSVKKRQYCGAPAQGRNFYISPSNKGLGLSCRF